MSDSSNEEIMLLMEKNAYISSIKFYLNDSTKYETMKKACL